MCGENERLAASDCPASGSSPRVRGKPFRPRNLAHASRLIPAYAGKTNRIASLVSNLPAHPRVCGENGIRRGKPTSPPGSSPRVRGKRLDGLQVDAADGLIPACAGKTSASRPRTARLPAHPRMCGENRRARWDAGIAWGSSPRVRGKQAREGYPFLFDGLIPACAGKTVLCSHRMCPWEAHPRVCGENSLTEISSKLTTGSSPRVRGKHAAYAQSRGNSGLIPACAGKTTRTQTTWCSPSAHPRVCGENADSYP